MLAMAERTTHWAFDDLSPEHRDLAVKAAAEEQISIKAWMERAVAEHGRRGAAGGYAASSESAAATTSESETVSERAGGYGRRASGHTRLHEGGGERVEDGLSTYHSRMASRAAAAEAVPVNIWLEEAVVERARRGEHERARPHAVRPEPAPATTVVKERGAGDRGFELVAAMLAGILVASLLILAVTWFGARPPWFPGGGGGGGASGSGKVMAAAPANGTTPGAAPFGAYVSVTTEVNTTPGGGGKTVIKTSSDADQSQSQTSAAPVPATTPPHARPPFVVCDPCHRRAPCCHRPHPRPPPRDCGCEPRADERTHVYRYEDHSEAPNDSEGGERSDGYPGEELDGR